ncbi:hypothetical protein RCC89_08785 [Cytophagaceae bacterium ABcell3]|nr:hypothetical protein RCC89_08785 [Cytophagaceae bacterium ABcell3]
MTKLSKYGLVYSIIKKLFPEVSKAEKKFLKTSGIFMIVISLPFLGVGLYYATQHWDAHWLLATILLVIGAVMFIPGLILFILSFTSSDDQ